MDILSALSDISSDAWIAFFLGIAAYYYDRGRRYCYLADRWNALMNINAGKSDYMKPEKTNIYRTWSNANEVARYENYARMCMGFVEDIIKSDYPWEKPLYILHIGSSFTSEYRYTISDFIALHKTWLSNNKRYFSNKFLNKLKNEFKGELNDFTI